MLVLTRKVGQQIVLSQGLIQFKVLKLDGNRISIGIKAPSHIEIDREEIYVKKQQQEKAATPQVAP